MGRVIAAAGLGSVRVGENSRNTAGRTRTKRKKRKKDLEKLHRNVHEAKDNLRRGAAREAKSTAFSKVLTNFADARQHNDETTHALAWKRGKKKNPRTICDRLLPEPIVGLYKNGAKGRQAYRVDEGLDGTSIARLESNVLKLLNGDETNPNSFGNQDDKGGRKRERERSVRSPESSVTSQSSRLVTDSPVRIKTKGDKWINRENDKNIVARKGPEERNDGLRPQRKNRCKRRLFEPNDESASGENNFRIIDRSEITNEICFTPRIAVDQAESRNNVEKYSPATKASGIAENPERKFDWRRVSSKFWGWFPETCYERLCAKVCAENFERNQRYIGQDPIAKAQKALGEVYAISRAHGSRKEKRIVETIKRAERPAADSRMDSPLHDFSSLSTFVESDDCSADLERDSPNSCAIKVGSWHADNFREISSENDGTPDRDTKVRRKKRVDDSSAADAPREANENRGQRRGNKKVREEKPSPEQVVRQPISSSFLKTFAESNDSSNGRMTFAEQFAAAAELCSREEKSDDDHVESRRTKSDIDAKKSLLRRDGKHVPRILRRSCGRSETLNHINESFQEPRQRSEKVVDSRADIRSDDYASDGTGSISSQNAKFGHRANFDRAPHDPSEHDDIANGRSDESRVGFFVEKENKTQRVERSENIEGGTSSAELADAESFDDTRCARLTPDHRYVGQAKEACTCFAQPRRSSMRRVTFDLERQPSCFVTVSKPGQPRAELPLAIYRDDYRLEKAARNVEASVTGKSEIEQGRAMNRHARFYDQTSFREANVSADYTPGLALRRNIRKPVVLFKPIRNNTEDRQNFSSHRETDRSAIATVSNAVKNLNVRADTKNLGGSSFAHEFSDPSYHRHAEQSLSQTMDLAIGTDAINGKILETRPTKFLAYLREGDGDPQRIPIYAKADRRQVVSVVPVPIVDRRPDSSGMSVARIPQFAEMMYVEYPDVKNSDERVVRYRQQLPLSDKVPSTSNDVPEDLLHPTNGESLDSACLNYSQASHGIRRNPNDGFRGIESLERRIRLADGTTGIFVPDNRGIVAKQDFESGPGFDHGDSRRAANHSHQLQHRHRLSSSNVASVALTSEAPRNVRNAPNGKPFASSRLEYRPEYRINCNERFRPNEDPPNRIALADGSTGMFYTENRSIDTERTLGFQQHGQIRNSHGVATGEKVSRNIVDMTNDRLTSAPVGVKYQPHYNMNASFNGGFSENDFPSSRVLLADGTTAIFVPENRTIDANGVLNNDPSAFNRSLREKL